MLVFADTWYPGWQASVDGKPARIYPAYNVVRALVLDSGQHEIVMRYRPTSIILSAFLCLIGLGLALAMRLIARQRTEPEKAAV